MKYYCYGDTARGILSDVVDNPDRILKMVEEYAEKSPHADSIQIPVWVYPKYNLDYLFGGLQKITFKYMPYKSTGEKRWFLEWNCERK